MQDNDKDKHDKAVTDLYAELSREQPSAALDEKILSQAHKAVESGRNVGPFSGSWMVPVSMAAVIVLSVMLVTLVDKEQPELGIGMSESTGKLEGETSIPPSLQSADPGTSSSISQHKSEFGESAAAGKPAVVSVVPGKPATVEGNALPEPATTREKKKQSTVSDRPAKTPSQKNQALGLAEPEAAVQPLSDESEQTHVARSRMQADDDTTQSSKAHQFADQIAASPARRKSMLSSEQAQPLEESVPAMRAASSPPKDKENMASKVVVDEGGSTCKQLDELGCLESPHCTLDRNEKTAEYICRTADNNCEKGFIQSDHQKSDCEAKPGCSYLPADCYCAPRQICQCRDGVPARCAAIQKIDKP